MNVVKTIIVLAMVVTASCLLDAAYIAKQVSSPTKLPLKLKILPQFGD
jgi:hypothetical protein